ncbi:MAG: HAD-IB family hydrolase [Myxococcota bacterium]|nr:HAD-IB family hydrolase [Myxococcota bacterium]
MATVFMDLDGTILEGNSGCLWASYEFFGGRLPFQQMLLAGYYLAKYKLIGSDIRPALEKAILGLKGQDSSNFVWRTEAFFDKWVVPRLREKAVQMVQFHCAQGDKVVLLTSSTRMLGEHVSRVLKLHGCVGTDLRVDDGGVFTGEVDGPLCFGEGKVLKAEEYLVGTGESIPETLFYTDSSTDLPMLEACGEPITVNPDRQLKRIALQRGWKVLDWAAL